VPARRPAYRFRLAAVCLALCAALGSPAADRGARASDFDVTDAPAEPHRGRARFSASGGSRLTASGPEVVLAFEVPYAELFFRPVGSRFEARFDVVMILLRDGKQVGGDSFTETRRVSRREDARSPRAQVRRRLSIPVRPGRYRAEVTLRESAAGREDRLTWDLEVPDYARVPLGLSSLWPASGGDSLADAPVAVPPEDWILAHEYGERATPHRVVGEVYRGDEGPDSTQLTWRVLGAREEELRGGRLRLPAGRRVVFTLEPDLSTLWLGDYQFEVRVRAGDREARRRCPFRMRATAHALEADAEQSLDLIEIIATSEEMADLRNAPVTERKEAWERFWRKRDPTPETPENEFRDEFFRRVRYANEHYAVLGPGWRSDRGRIYIQYGAPDQLETYPFNIDAPAYEIWIYQRLMKRFVFVDYDGFGRYELYQPGRL
jgi:GWxTD domain-containing protein